MSEPLATKVSTPLSEYDLLMLQGLRFEWGAGVLNLVLSLSHTLILVTEVQHGTSWQRTLWGSGEKKEEDAVEDKFHWQASLWSTKEV